MTLEIWRLEMEIGDDFLFSFFYFWPEEPAAPVLTLRCGGTMRVVSFLLSKKKKMITAASSQILRRHISEGGAAKPE